MKKKIKGFTYSDIVIIKFVVALLMLIGTSLTIGKTGKWGDINYFSIGFISLPILFLPLKSLFQMPEAIVYMFFGLFHSFIATEQVKQKKMEIPTINFLANWILYTVFYKLILLPACGFGYFEWFILIYVFACEFGFIAQSKKIKKPNFNAYSLVVFGLFLWMLKIIVRYMFPKNLAVEILGNNTAVNIIAVFIVIAAIYGIRRGVQGIKITNEEKNVIQKTSAVGKKIIKSLSGILCKLLKIVISLVTTLVTNPVILLIIVVSSGVLSIGGIIFYAHKVDTVLHNIRTDILNFINPILSVALKADNAAYADDYLNTVGMVCSFILFITSIIFEYNVQRHVEKEEERIQIEIDVEKKKKDDYLNIYAEESKKQLEQKSNNAVDYVINDHQTSNTEV